MNNLHRVQNIFVSDGSAFPANNATVASVTAGKIGVYGGDWLALNPAGGDTIATQPYIYIVEGKTTVDGVSYVKKSMKIDGRNVISYKASSYTPAKRNVWAIGHNRKTAVGTIEVANSTEYKYTIRFKNDKFNYSERPEVLTVSFTSAASATQLSIATQIAGAINSSAYSGQISAIVVGDGTGVYGVTGATDYGVEITALDVAQFVNTTYTQNKVYFSVHVDDSTGFGTTTTCTEIQTMSYGVGTYAEVYNLENKDFGYEGVLNRRQWPIPALDYSSSSTLINSAAITPVATGTAGEDEVTVDLTIASIIRPGEKVEIDGVNYEVKYIKGTGTGVTAANALVLTSVLTTSPAASAVKVRVKYDMVSIEFNDVVNSNVANSIANKSVIIAVPALDAGDAYNGVSAAGQDVMDVLNGWLATAPGVFASISI